MDTHTQEQMDTRLGVPTLGVAVAGGGAVRALWDTGAMHTVVPMSRAGALAGEGGPARDYNPILGHFDIALRTGGVRAGGADLGSCPVATGAGYDAAMAPFGFQAILGTSSLRGRRVYADYARGLFGVQQ